MKSFQKILFLVLVVSLTNCSNSTAQQQAAQTANPALLAPDDFETKAAQAGTQLVDVRTPEEYQAGHIGNALNINFRDADFKEKMDKLDKSKPVAVYCGVGGRSGKTVTLLNQLGFKTVYDLQGGITAWRAKGKKVN